MHISWNRFKGKLPPNAVKVDRSTKWGNPFKVADHGRDECVKLYWVWLKEKLKESPGFLEPLMGKDLACSCKLSDSCHADVLLEFL